MTTPRASSALVVVGVFVLLAVHYALAVGSKRTESTTSDELVHVTGGYVFNHFNDYRLHPENGVLPQRLAALPAIAMGSRFPPLDQPFWRTSNSWVIGHQFFYEIPNQDHFPGLLGARAVIALFSVATGLLVFLWSRELFGTAGGFVSLGFFAFSPTFLAHGALATSDVAMTFCMLAACGAWWRHLHDPRLRWWWLSAILFGLACVAKFSAPLLLPMFVAMSVVRAWSGEPVVRFGRAWEMPAGKLTAAVLSGVGHAAVGLVIIWAFFGFRFSAFNPALPPAEHFIRPWEWLDENLGTSGHVIRRIAAWRLLPEAYLYGLAYVLETAQVRSAFLNGEYSTTGWSTFFLWAFALKSTVGLIVGSVIAATVAFRRVLAERAARLAPSLRLFYRATPLIVLFVIYWAFSITSHLNIGHRHIMPTYPVLFVMCGVMATWLTTRHALRIACVVALLGVHAIESLRAHPHYLAFFNVVAGPPEERHRHLVDSSLDWGQDLPGLQAWLARHTTTTDEVYLSYFGTGEPDYYRIRAHRLPFVNGFKLPKPPIVRLTSGVYCISATMLEHVYSPIRGPWTVALEREYAAARSREAEFANTLGPQPNDELRREADRYELLRFARLCHYLRARRPDDHVGSSILIYRLTTEELQKSVYGSLQDWAAALEHAVVAASR